MVLDRNLDAWPIAHSEMITQYYPPGQELDDDQPNQPILIIILPNSHPTSLPDHFYQPWGPRARCAWATSTSTQRIGRTFQRTRRRWSVRRSEVPDQTRSKKMVGEQHPLRKFDIYIIIYVYSYVYIYVRMYIHAHTHCMLYVLGMFKLPY